MRNSGVAAPADTLPSDSAAARIRVRVTAIEHDLPTYRRLERALTGLSAEGGVLEAYGVEGAARGGIRKLVATHFGETGRAVETFYYGHSAPDSLILATVVREQYSEPLSGRVVRRDEEQFYFWRGALLRVQASDGRVRDSTDVDARARAAEVLRTARELYTCANGLRGLACADADTAAAERAGGFPKR